MTLSPRRFKDDIFNQFARIAKALSNPKRLELLDLLCQGPQTVEVLAEKAALSPAGASQHLQVLRTARLVDSEKSGLFVTCRLSDQSVGDFYLSLRTLAEKRLAEIEQIKTQFLFGKEGFEPVDRIALLEKVREGAVTVLDVRPEDEYRAGHIRGAISIPLKELENRLSELSQDSPIVAYCRGPYCVLALQAVEALQAKGFRAFRLAEGVQEWRARGWPVEMGGGTR